MLTAFFPSFVFKNVCRTNKKTVIITLLRYQIAMVTVQHKTFGFPTQVNSPVIKLISVSPHPSGPIHVPDVGLGHRD